MDSADPIRAYLIQLEAAMAGRDAALVHDAVLDADAHLRAAVRAGASPERAVAEYGTPEEVARAYVEAESGPRGWRDAPAPGPAPIGTARQAAAPVAADARSAAPGSTPSAATAARSGLRDIPVLGIWFDVRAWGALAYFGAVGFVLSLAYFVWAISVGALALGLLPLVIGIPLLVLLLGSARAICLFEGKVVEFFLRVRMPRRVQPVAGTGNGEVGFWTRIGCWLRDIRSWMSLGYLVGNFPVAVVTFVVIVTLASVGIALVSLPITSAMGLAAVNTGGDPDVHVNMLGQELLPDADGNIVVPILPALLLGLIGLSLLTGTLWIARGLGVVYGYAVQAIQVARPQPLRTVPTASTSPNDPPVIAPR